MFSCLIILKYEKSHEEIKQLLAKVILKCLIRQFSFAYKFNYHLIRQFLSLILKILFELISYSRITCYTSTLKNNLLVFFSCLAKISYYGGI